MSTGLVAVAILAMLNAAAPPLLTTLDTLVNTPVFHILRQYRQLSGKARVFSETEYPTVAAPKHLNLPQHRSVPLLDVSAGLDVHRLTVFVINRDHQEDLDAEIGISAFNFSKLVQIHMVAANGYQAVASKHKLEMGAERIGKLEWSGHPPFPPCSVTAMLMEKSS